MASRIAGDLYVDGNVSSLTLGVPAGTITNASVNAAAGIVATKLVPQQTITYGQAGSAVDATVVVHCAQTAGTIAEFCVGSVVLAIGAAVVTVDLKKNGTTCLSAPITLDSANTAYVAEDGTLTVTTYVAGDVLTIVVDETAGGGTAPTGLFASVSIREGAT